MSGEVTLEKLRELIRVRAKMQNSKFIKDAELNDIINESISSLHDLIIQHRGDEYFEKSSTISLSQGVYEYDLPSDFYKLNSIENDSHRPLDSFSRSDKNYNQGFLKYKLSNGKIVFNRDHASGDLTLYYIPVTPVLSNNEDSTDFYNGWEKFVICDCARVLLEMEESDSSHLLREMQRIMARIEMMAPKDYHRPKKITDVKGRNYYEDYRP